MNLDHRSRRIGRVALLACLTVLAACANPPARTASPAVPGSSIPAGGSTSGAPQTAAPDAPASTSSPPPVMTPQEVQRTLTAAVDLLQAGQEDQAETELAKVLQSDPGNRLAQSLMRQIKDDPNTALGRDSFNYRVQPGESLSRIAQRFMGDVYQFYILARYNNIKVPRNLAGGQMIRVPGKAPSSSPPNPTTSRDPAPSQPPVTTAPPAASAPVAESEAAVSARLNKQKAEAVARHTRAARAAFAKQDLEGALRSWDGVLAIEPENRTALLERQRVLGLMEKLGKVK